MLPIDLPNESQTEERIQGVIAALAVTAEAKKGATKTPKGVKAAEGTKAPKVPKRLLKKKGATKAPKGVKAAKGTKKPKA